VVHVWCGWRKDENVKSLQMAEVLTEYCLMSLR